MEDLDCKIFTNKYEVFYIDNVNEGSKAGAYLNKITFTQKYFDALAVLD